METKTTTATTPMETAKGFFPTTKIGFFLRWRLTHDSDYSDGDKKVFSHEGVFPKIKRQRFFPNRRLGFSKNKKAGVRPYKKKVFFPTTRLGFSYKTQGKGWRILR